MKQNGKRRLMENNTFQLLEYSSRCEECFLPVSKPDYDIQEYVSLLGYKHKNVWRHERCFWTMVNRNGWLKEKGT